MQQQQKITMAYILGLMEADGGILLMFGTGKSKTTLKPWIRISQKSNPNLLALIKEYFESHGIECEYETWNAATSKGRATNLTITKANSARKFIELVKKEPLQFISQKQRDFWILDRVLNTPQTLSIADKISLKKSMHKANRNEPDLNANGALTRETLELKYNIPLGSSNADASNILSSIDAKYEAHAKHFEDLIAKNALNLPPDWVAGLIDGDGSYYVTMQVQEPSSRYSKRMIQIQANFTLTMEINSLLTLKAIKSIVGSEAPIQKAENHYQMWFRNQTDVKALLEFQQAYLPLGNRRKMQYNLVKQINEWQEKGQMGNLNNILSIIRAAYALSEDSKGRGRTRTQEEMEAIAKEIYG